MMIGMRCSTDERLKRLRNYIKEYQRLCSVSSANMVLEYYFLYPVNS